ncbi:hypothetical protein BBK36DRAFT_1181490 [Trichoderma citrinoviride]|uniref:Modin n=1 Tax=Trichoderma citrinoviride TaxID=58853 RepID=A0A2T4B1T4_9HYPO|nr:hypothetical protein BBK36DRAFT_1181490 [Trichoderma citrinoviride]PTB63286.1 hypothetical protein BBK36DRAFT_1181490 [Trichoderma citrinoviride]
MANTDNTELILAIVALIISILAFVIAILQALQQYFASATGYSSCSEAVIGKWSQFSHRRLLWKEFRIEVQFETPVLFVAKPENTRGPLGNDEDFREEDRKIIRLDGSHTNLRYTSSTEEFNEQQKKNKQQAVHTADNENASWCQLLMTVYQMEKDSRTWQKESLGYHPPFDPSPPHSLVVCMQRKKRVWDSMPQGLTKPYATTTISHLVEIAAMLGIHWKNFDLNNDRYRAQGNGFVLYGSYFDNLGIAFTFQKQGPTVFRQDRVIPTHDIKKLCFGLVPTILYREKLVDVDDHKDYVTLQLGGYAEIADTLAELGCDNNTINHFRKTPESSRHSHLFPGTSNQMVSFILQNINRTPVAFEILGMVGEIFHIKDTAFRMLPNPTPYYWEPNTFSLSTLTSNIAALLKAAEVADALTNEGDQVSQLLDWYDQRTEKAGKPPNGSINTEISVTTPADRIAHLRAGVELCDRYLDQVDIGMVFQVVRVHIQEVMGMLNEKAGSDEPAGPGLDNRGQSSTITISDIDSASVDEKHHLLAQIYCTSIRNNVIQTVFKQRSQYSEKTTAEMAGSEISVKRDINQIWCTLIFRMLYWLQLHNFHKKDVQIGKGDAYDSRIPVYIL